MPIRADKVRRGRSGALRALAAVLAVVTIAGCGDKKDSEASYIRRGKELAAKGDLTGADVLLRNALQINPKSAEALSQLAADAEKRGDVQAAYRLYLRVTEEQPGNVVAQAKLGQIYAGGGDLKRAQEQEQTAVKLDPDNVEVMLLQGLIAYRSHDLAKAQERAKAVLAKDPGNVDASGMLARTLEEGGQVDDAVATYDAALAQHPDATALRIMKTKTLERAKRFDAADASYRDLIQREPKVYEFRLALARALEQQGKGGDAEAVLREAIANGVGGSRPKIDLVDLMIRENKAADADAELKRMAAAAPDEYPLQFKLADRDLKTDQPAEAKRVLEAVVKGDPDGRNGVAARLALAKIALREGHGDEADTLIADVLKLDASNSDALMLRAQRSLAHNAPEPAIVDLRTVLRDEPNSREAKRMLAGAYFAAGKIDLAEKQLVELLDQDSNDTAAKYDLAYLRARRGESGEALALLDEVVKSAPKAVAPLRAKAMMLIADKKWADAEDTIQQLSQLPDQQRLADMLYGVLYLASNRPKDAVTAFKQAHELAPTASAPINGVVRAYLSQNDVAGATQFIQEMIAKNPESGYLQNSYGELLLQASKTDAAVAALQKASTLSPDWPLPYFNLARAYIAKGEPEHGIETLDAGLKKAPNDALLLRTKADVQLVQGQTREALASYLKLLDAHPDDKTAANNAAALIADTEYQDAAALKRAVELVKPFDDSSNPNYLDTLGWVRYRAGDFELAKVALTRAAKRLPDDPQIQYHLGMARYRLGDRDGARAALQAATAAGGRSYPGIEEARATLQQLATDGGSTTKP